MRSAHSRLLPRVLVTLGLLLSTAAAAQAKSKPAPAQLPPGTQALPPEVTRLLEARVREQLVGRQLGGLSVGVVRGNEAWTAGFGFRDMEHRLKATPRTTYRMASVSKCFTAIAVMQLVEAGEVSLDDDIRKWVPDFPAKPWTVTVRQLLGHLGGVSHYKDPAKDNRLTKRMTTAEALAIFKDWPLVVEPGTEYVYTSYGFNLLGALVENASHEPFGKVLQQKVFGPAGMTHAALDDFRTRDGWQAVGYRVAPSGLARSHKLDLSSRFGGGGARASVVDMLAFGRAVIASELVKPETNRMMHVSMETRDGRLTDYGMGFATYPVRGHYVVAHAGGQPETSTFLLMLPAEHVVIALATNVEGQDDLLRDIYGALLEVLLEGGARRHPVHSTAPEDEVLHEALFRMYSYGRAFYTFQREGFGQPVEPGDLPSAFAEVSKLLARENLAADPRAALKQVKQSHHPSAGRLFIRVGMQMAERIATAFGPEALNAYPAEGALGFFDEYLRACEKENCPEPLRFSPGLRADIARLVGPWRKANAPEFRTLLLDDAGSERGADGARAGVPGRAGASGLLGGADRAGTGSEEGSGASGAAAGLGGEVPPGLDPDAAGSGGWVPGGRRRRGGGAALPEGLGAASRSGCALAGEAAGSGKAPPDGPGRAAAGGEAAPGRGLSVAGTGRTRAGSGRPRGGRAALERVKELTPSPPTLQSTPTP